MAEPSPNSEHNTFEGLLDLLINLKTNNQTLLFGETSRARALVSSYSEDIVRLSERLKIFLQGDWHVEVRSTSSMTFFPTYSSSEKSSNILKRVGKKVFNGYDSYVDLLGICEEKYGTRVDLTVGELLEGLIGCDLDDLKITKSQLEKLDSKFLGQVI